MTGIIYPLYKQALLAGGSNADLDNDDATNGPYCALVNISAYTYSAGHQFYSDLSGIVGTDQRITGPSVSVNGVFDGDDLLYSAVSGNTIGALVIYRRNSGANTTWRLVSYYDTVGGGLPLVPAGTNIAVVWNNQGIFRL